MLRFALAAGAVLMIGIGLYVFWPGRTAPDIGPGISQALADDRAERISDLTYEVSLDIPASRTEAI